MNADLMITIALCLYVALGSLAVAMFFAQSIRDDTAKEAEAKRRLAGGERAERSGSRRRASRNEAVAR
jgi:hypothetical protein